MNRRSGVAPVIEVVAAAVDFASYLGFARFGERAYLLLDDPGNKRWTRHFGKLIQDGGIPMYILLGSSVVAIAVAFERLTAQWRYIPKARELADSVTRCLARGAYAEGRTACERSKSPLADVFLAGYERHGRARRSSVVGAVHRERLRVSSDMKRWVWILGTIGATAPFIGLFGTVVGGDKRVWRYFCRWRSRRL